MQGIEDTLLKFRPAGPPENLRQVILATADAAPPAARPARRWPTYLFRTAIAAALLISFGLHHAAEALNQATANAVGLGPILWTKDAEETAQLIAPGPAGRKYLLDRLLATGRQVIDPTTGATP